MPRQYMQPQPGLFVGQSARQDMAQGRARADQERIRQQRLQGFQYTGQARQAARTQREAQRAAQQQMAMASRERDADRQFQMQRDAFGARRDYAMQERRIQSAAEQAQFGRDFEREQQETRFGQQQDLARQEQDYRLQQLDIAAQDQFLSAEQQAEIQRERDMLVSDMQRDAAREGRFEQFAYGQMAAEEAARRPLSVAERQRLRFGDELSARQQFRGEDIATRGAHLQQKFTRENAERAEHAKREFLELSTEARKEIIGVEAGVAINFLDRETQARILVAYENQFLEDEARERQYNKQRDREAQKNKDNQLAQDLADIDDLQGVSDAEKDYLKKQRIADDAKRPLIYGETARDRFDRNVHTTDDGAIYSSPPNGPPSLLSPPPPPPIIIEGQPHKPGSTVVVGGRQFLVTDRGLSPIADTPEAIQKRRDDDREDKKFAIAFANHIREKSATVKVKDGITGTVTEQPKYTLEQQQQMDRDFANKWEPEPETSTPPQEQGGAADSRQRASAAPSAALPQSDMATGDWAKDPFDQIITDEADAAEGVRTATDALNRIRTRPVDKAWASSQIKLIQDRNAGREFKDWPPKDKAVFKKAVDDLRSGASPAPSPAPTSASARRGSSPSLSGRGPAPLP